MIKIKKLVIFALSLLLVVSSYSFTFAEENITFNKEATINEIEQIVEDYLEENEPSIKFGSKEYMEYLLLQLMESRDEKLTQHSNYKEICAYASIYLAELDEAQTRIQFAEDGLFILDEAIKNKTFEEVQKEVREEEKKIEREFGIESEPRMLSSYNANSAASYAIRWGEGRNKLYNDHFKDCTNFVAQAVEAGGMNQDYMNPVPGITSTTTRWYSQRYEEWHGNNYVYAWKESSSWIGVGDFYSYWTRKGASSSRFSTLSGVQNYAKIGDVVQLKDANGSWYHSIIITGGRSGDLYYSGHTNNYSNRRLEGNAGGTAEFRVIRFN